MPSETPRCDLFGRASARAAGDAYRHSRCAAGLRVRCKTEGFMNRRRFLVVAAAAAALPQAAVSQNKPGNIRIGWLTPQGGPTLTPYLAALRQGFADLGYVEGHNLLIDYRFGDDRPDRVPDLA